MQLSVGCGEFSPTEFPGGKIEIAHVGSNIWAVDFPFLGPIPVAMEPKVETRFFLGRVVQDAPKLVGRQEPIDGMSYGCHKQQYQIIMTIGVFLDLLL